MSDETETFVGYVFKINNLVISLPVPPQHTMIKAIVLPVVLTVVVLINFHASSGQFPPTIPGKWRNPRIQRYFNYICRRTQCGFENVCELRPMPCLVPPCQDGPSCIPTPGSISKPGRCPHPYRIWAWRARCNTDYGCYDSQVCCHGFWGSECRPPLMS
ncbi:uncharacterized protein [Argopecten irradians]|uniref:uncharacterized protein n=1 Tax=Argopecten irradians TaxID=31199 RepID=UPI00372049F3